MRSHQQHHDPQHQQTPLTTARTLLPEQRLLVDKTRAWDVYAFEIEGVEDKTGTPTPSVTPKMRDDETLQATERTEPSTAPTMLPILDGAVVAAVPPDGEDDSEGGYFLPVGAEESNTKNDKEMNDPNSNKDEGDDAADAKDDKNNEGDPQTDAGDDPENGEGNQSEQDPGQNESDGAQNGGNGAGEGQQSDAEAPEEIPAEAGEGSVPESESNQQEDADNPNWEGGNPENEEEEQQAEEQVEETGASGTDPTDEDNFVPVLDTAQYYYVDLRPFSVFVEADRDLTTDLGIPLYLLLEMEETLENMVNVHISNLTINMGVVHADHDEQSPTNRRSLVSEEPRDHYHWNELLFQGVAEFDNSVVYTPTTVQNVQSLVLSSPANLQAFWDNEGGEVYQSLEVVNITLLAAPTSTEGQEDGKLEDISPDGTQQDQQTQQLQNEETDSKRASNVWIMVPLVIIFLLVCLCLIGFAGRLKYLGSRARERYDEKYGLDYNVYDKDISKDIFKEEYLMSEHGGEDFLYNNGGAGLSGSNSSIDFLSRPINSIKAVRGSSKARNVPVADDETPTEEEDMNGSSDDSHDVFSNEEHEASMSSSQKRESFVARAPGEDGSFPSESTAQNIGAPTAVVPMESSDKEERFNDESLGSSHSSNIDNGDTLPELLVMGNLSAREQSTRSIRSIDSLNSIPNDDGNVAMGNSSSRSAKDRSMRSMRSTDSFGSGKDGGSVMGNMSGRSRSERSTRSQRSFGSFPSDGSFYSCQGDLV